MTVYIFPCLLWSLLQYYGVTGAPFPNIPTPYAVPLLHNHGVTPSRNGFLFNSGPGLVPTMCPTPVPILNRSVPCDQSYFRRLDLSDQMLKQVLADEGGHYVTDYMASSDDEASQNFRNLIYVNSEYEDVDFEAHSSDWSWDYRLTKKVLLSQLEETYREYYATTTALPQVKPSHASYRKDESNREEVTPDTAKVDIGDNQNLLLQDSTRKQDINVKVPRHMLTSLNPAQYVYPEHQRHQRDANGATSQMEYCVNLTKAINGYFRLCSTCAHTTTQASDRFPRILNEVWCNTDRKGCMYVGQAGSKTAHGGCRQSVFHMTMLRKKPNSCMTILNNGRHYITDEWEKYAQPIKFGCECMIDKRSPFAKYVEP